MNVCGIELKSNDVFLCVLRSEKNKYEYIDTKIKKLQLKDSGSSKEIIKLKNTLDDFFKENEIKKVIIKKRMEKGMYAGSTTSFKIEGLIQLNEQISIEFFTAQKIASIIKKSDIVYPEELNSFQKTSFDTAYAFIKS